MKIVLWIVSGVVALAALGFAGWMATLPGARPAMAQPPVPADETAAMLAALRPPKRERPVVAIIGINDATETTDYLMPYGILKRSDVLDVSLISTQPGSVNLFPALQVEPDMTAEDFDRANPDGADYVIVPAMSRDDDPAALEWIRKQAEGGAVIIGVCAGAKVVGAAGLLNGKRATTHWFYLKELLGDSPSAVYVADRRIVADERVTTTTGITASMPMMLTLIEAVAGKEKAEAVAGELGLVQWDARHDSGAFRFTRDFAATVMGNVVAFWNRDRFGIELKPGMDEVSLALVADAWSRTYRSRAVTIAGSQQPVSSANGLRIVPDEVAADWTEDRLDAETLERKPVDALDAALAAIEASYGMRTANVVAMQLEYPR